MWLLFVFLIVHQVLRMEGFALAVQEEGMDEPENSLFKVEEEMPWRRNLYQFARMTRCATNRKARDFNGYGCWCGRGGEGRIVDEVDRCCYEHDHCYGRVEDSNVCGTSLRSKTLAVYVTTYKRDENDCTGCAPKSAYKKSENWAECKYQVCTCDSEAVRCFAKAEFHKEYKGYRKRNDCSKKEGKQ